MQPRGPRRPRPRTPLHLAAIAAAALVCVGLCAALVACGGTRGQAATPPPHDGTPTATATPSATPSPTPPAAAHPSLTPAQLRQDRPNELGRVLILEYHQIGTPESQFVRSPQHLRDDLQWLYEHDFVTVPLIDYLENDIHAPAGKRPVVLTFDDGREGQFRYLVDPGGQTRPDPNSAVPILMDFARTHPGFGHAATFYLLPYGPFGATDAQLAYAQQKLDFLVANGFEIGNHTLDHTNLATVSDAEVTKELASAVRRLHHYLPSYEPHTVALPFGGYPRGGPALLAQGAYDGTTYNNIGALLVGASPAPSPASAAFDPMHTPRVQAYGPVLAQWFATIERHPEEFYVSDGDPDTITAPASVPSSLGSIDAARMAAEGRMVVRY